MTTPRPPQHLTKETKRWFSSVVNEFELQEHHRHLLLLACESWDRCVQAREALAKHGTVYTDRYGQPRSRPEIAVERDSRIAFARLLRELGLDVIEPEASRAPRIQGHDHLRMAK